MDFVDFGVKDVMRIGGSSAITLPPAVMRNAQYPKSFKIEMSADKVIKLVPVYSLFLVGLINLTFLVTARLLNS